MKWRDRVRSGVVLGLVVVQAAGLAKAAAEPAADAKEQAARRFERIAQAFLNSKWTELAEALRMPAGQLRHLMPQQRADLAYVRKTFAECRPKWWKAAKATTPKAFRVTVWGRSMSVIYSPADKSNVNIDTVRGRRVIKVSWNPSRVDSDRPAAEGMPAGGPTVGDVAELTVWSTLANAQLMTSIPMQTISRFYNQDKEGFQRYMRFRTNLAALHHCGPKARQPALIGHLSTFGARYDSSPVAGSHRAIGAMLIAEVLMDPSKWPSLPLPAYVADAADAEEIVALHFRMQVGKGWTIAEDRALRAATLAFAKKNDKQVLQNGKVLLPNGLVFMLKTSEDRPFEAKRNAWILQQLKIAAKAGR